jgi:uncharacterized protein (DUF2062 family)
MNTGISEPGVANSQSGSTHHSWIYRRVLLPVFALLRLGVTPRRLAWSIALGLLVGVNPLFGTTTLLCLLLSYVFRLNIAAAQIANHAVFPLEIALVLPLIRLGSLLFRTGPLPLARREFLADAKTRPFALVHQVWTWEWHAFVLWIIIAAFALPLIATILTPVLKRVDDRVRRHRYPLVPID